tara:strand:+ start:365 stop:1801 length:1437 start_codon:yes stop_codon:yes gene_type:complete
MRASIYIIFLLFIGNTFSFGQDSKKKILLNKSDKIYLNFTVNKPQIITNSNNKDGFYILKDSQILSLKKGEVNVFYKWLNPLTNNLKMTDSLYIDSRDKEIQDFIKKVLTQFNVPSDGTMPNPAFTSIRGCSASDFSFQRLEILELLNLGNSQLTGVSNTFCDAFKSLYNIEQRGIKSVSDSIKNYRKRLIGISEHQDVETVTNDVEKAIKSITDSYKEDFFTLVSFEKDFNNRAIISGNPLLYSKLKSFYNEEFKLLESNKEQVLKLAEYIAVLRESVKGESDEINGYFYLHTIEIPEGKESLSKLTRTTKKFDETSIEFKEETRKLNEFVIRKHDFIQPKVGTGIFYSNAKLSTFGVSTNDDGQLTVSEDEIEKNTAVIALFLNLNIDINSRYLSPLLQIGIDPTKERPYLLIGGGFSIPSSNFSITGGPIWTWNASLEKLSVGDIIESSTEVEDEITYKFDVKPKGYYLGLTYSF